jgi:hypothetical protein
MTDHLRALTLKVSVFCFLKGASASYPLALSKDY